MKWKGKSVQIICKISNERMCTRKKDVEKLSCGFEEKYTKSAVRVVLYMLFSDRTATAVRSDSVRSTMTSAALFPDKHLHSLAQCYNFVRRNTNNNIINNLNEKHNYEYQVRNSRHQECQGRG